MSNAPKQWRGPHGRKLPDYSSRTLIMGILNVTPDSFSDGGAWGDEAKAVAQAVRLAGEGADIIDVGGESTRPGAGAISAADERSRVIPVIEGIRRELPDVPVSIDTYKADVARAAIEAGADLVNDVWGLKWDLSKAAPGEPSSPMAAAAVELRCPVIAMHNRSSRNYRDFWKEFLADVAGTLRLAAGAGIPHHQIWLDPGFGFGKEPRHNLEVLHHLDRLVALGYPVLLGTSRKSTIGLVLDRPVDQRLEGTAATVVWGIAKGCRMVRVHEVAAVRPFIVMADAIAQGISHGQDPDR